MIGIERSIDPTRSFQAAVPRCSEVFLQFLGFFLTPVLIDHMSIVIYLYRSAMISRTSEYALQAMIHLARHIDDWPIAGWKIAEETGIPRKYLASVLGDLVRAHVLDSSPGMGGGFRLARSAKDIRLSEVFAPFEPILADRRPCPFGQDACSDDYPCAGHEEWKRVREAYGRFLEKNTIHDVAFMRKKRRGATAWKRTKR